MGVGGVVLAMLFVPTGIEWRSAAPLNPGNHAGELWSGNGLQIPFRWCPPGTFLMGSAATEPGRASDEGQVVTLTEGYWMGQTEVTQGQWQSVMGTTPWRGETWGPEGTNYPAEYVSCSGDPDSAVEFCVITSA